MTSTSNVRGRDYDPCSCRCPCLCRRIPKTWGKTCKWRSKLRQTPKIQWVCNMWVSPRPWRIFWRIYWRHDSDIDLMWFHMMKLLRYESQNRVQPDVLQASSWWNSYPCLFSQMESRKICKFLDIDSPTMEIQRIFCMRTKKEHWKSRRFCADTNPHVGDSKDFVNAQALQSIYVQTLSEDRHQQTKTDEKPTLCNFKYLPNVVRAYNLQKSLAWFVCVHKSPYHSSPTFLPAKFPRICSQPRQKTTNMYKILWTLRRSFQPAIWRVGR